LQEEQINLSDETKGNLAPRQLRSTLTSTELTATDNPKQSGIHLPKSKKKTINTTVNFSTLLDRSISELSRRSDFLEIVRDLQNQSVGVLESRILNILVADDCSEITIDNVPFSLGDDIDVYSSSTNQSFSGSISRISSNNIVLSLVQGGARIRILIEQIQRGRLLLSKTQK